jgi:heptosyltransferase-2
MSAPLAAGVHLLVRVPDWLGDLVMSEPALRALDEHVSTFGGSMTLAGSPRLLAALDGNLPNAPRVDANDVNAWRGHDVALLFVNSFRSAWLAARARIPRRVGWSRNLRGWLLTETIAPAREAGRTPVSLGIPGRFPRYLPRPFGATCIELSGALAVPVRDSRPRLSPSAKGVSAVQRRLTSFGMRYDEPFVLANVGARPDSAKAYPVELWARALAEFAHRCAWPIVLACGPGEETPLRALLDGASRSPHFFACVDPIADLPELVALCNAARLFITADSGPRHIAVATDTPLVVVAGPTDPRHTADHTRSTRLIRVPVDCGPCHREVCPLTGAAHHACMRRVEPDLVAHAALELVR